MTIEYVVTFTEFDPSACEVVRSWDEVWPSLDPLEYSLWDTSACSIDCPGESGLLDGSRCCDGGTFEGQESGSGAGEQIVVEYTTYDFSDCLTTKRCAKLGICDPLVYGCCGCDAIPRFWQVTIPTYTDTSPSGGDCTQVPPGVRVLELFECNVSGGVGLLNTSWVTLDELFYFSSFFGSGYLYNVVFTCVRHTPGGTRDIYLYVYGSRAALGGTEFFILAGYRTLGVSPFACLGPLTLTWFVTEGCTDLTGSTITVEAYT